MTQLLPLDEATAAARIADALDSVATPAGLTRIQREVLALAARGLSNKEIAAQLGRAENTAELHMTQLMRKLQVTSRAQLIATFWMRAFGAVQ